LIDSQIRTISLHEKRVWNSNFSDDIWLIADKISISVWLIFSNSV
jgi:hypothetical protein